MKIIILHGENINRSYQRLMRLIEAAKARGWEIIYDEVAATPSLFGKQRLLVVKDYRILPKNLVKLDGTLVIYHEGNLPPAALRKIGDARVEKFDLPKILWKFLNKPSVKLFHEVIKKEPVELVFHLLAKRLRNTRYVGGLAQMDYEAKAGKVDLLLALDLFIAKHLE